MEELLNKLIQRWWKPFDVKWISEYFFESVPVGLYRLCWKKPDYDYNVYSKRDLVSKESWLWQFCVENNLVKLIENPNENKLPRDRMSEEEFRMWEYNVYYSFSNKKDIHKRYEQDSLTYRLIESALCNEEDLEKFLLDNIKI